MFRNYHELLNGYAEFYSSANPVEEEERQNVSELCVLFGQNKLRSFNQIEGLTSWSLAGSKHELNVTPLLNNLHYHQTETHLSRSGASKQDLGDELNSRIAKFNAPSAADWLCIGTIFLGLFFLRRSLSRYIKSSVSFSKSRAKFSLL